MVAQMAKWVAVDWKVLGLNPAWIQSNVIVSVGRVERKLLLHINHIYLYNSARCLYTTEYTNSGQHLLHFFRGKLVISGN